jgi:hypothetical protein
MKRCRARVVTLTFGAALAAIVVAGCGGSSKPAEAPQKPGTPQQQEYPATDSFSEEEMAPQSEAAPAGALMPGSMRSESAADEGAGAPSIETLSRDLDSALSLSTPDCPSAHLLRDQICDLSRRICGLSDERRGDHELVERCGDARARCQRAVDRTQAACP